MADTPVVRYGKTANACGLTLAEYAEIIGYDERRFYGVDAGDNLQYQCREFWTRWQRDQLQHYLNMAQGLIEDELTYHLCPAWDVGEEHPPVVPLESNWTRAIAAGVRAESDIEIGSTVDYTTDPDIAIIGPIATTVTNADEVYIFYPDSDDRIDAQEIVIEPAGITIFIPRCRLVKVELQASSVPYADDANYVGTVDVKRVYNDPSTNAEIVFADGCGCETTSQTACMTLELGTIGKWRVKPATYDADTGLWSTSYLACHGVAYSFKLNYLSGTKTMSQTMKSAVIRLAHSLMPAPPCGCQTINSLWKRDRNVPLVTDRERLNCPFGMSDGAWFSWNIAVSNKVGWSGVM